jgi:hypothetical protein
VSPRLIFVVVATVAATGSAVLAGIIVAVVGLSARMPTATLITSSAGSATAVFGGVIALAGLAASLLFNAPGPDGRKHPATSLGRQRSKADPALVAGPGRSFEYAVCDGELRAAVEARALFLEAARAERHERADRGEIRPYQGRDRHTGQR